MSEILAARLKKLIAAAQAHGYVTFEELNEAMPAEDYTSEQIEEVVTALAQKGIQLLDSPEMLRVRDDKIDRETVCERSIRRIETAGAALRHGKVRLAYQLMEATLAELRPFADS